MIGPYILKALLSHVKETGPLTVKTAYDPVSSKKAKETFSGTRRLPEQVRATPLKGTPPQQIRSVRKIPTTGTPTLVKKKGPTRFIPFR